MWIVTSRSPSPTARGPTGPEGGWAWASWRDNPQKTVDYFYYDMDFFQTTIFTVIIYNLDVFRLETHLAATKRIISVVNAHLCLFTPDSIS